MSALTASITNFYKMEKILLTAEELNMIQTLRKQKAQMGAESTHSNEGANKKTDENKQEQPKEETPELLNYKKDLEEIKDLLKVIAEKLIDVRGGF